MGKMDEMIVVAPRTEVFGADDAHAFQGATTDRASAAFLLGRLANGATLIRRGDAEEDETLKQPIPYAVVLREGETLEILVYERLGAGGEKRLHGRLSVGVGGHMNLLPDRSDPLATFREEARREISEELFVTPVAALVDAEIELVGMINDDSDAVGRVHIGLLLAVCIPEGATVAVRETDQLRSQWLPLAAVTDEAIMGRLENWSRLAVQVIQADRLAPADRTQAHG